MFERFTTDAREAVVQAQVEARGLGHGFIGTEHLLLGLAGGSPDDLAAAVLRGEGLSVPRIREEVLRIVGQPRVLDDADSEALRAIGIDLDAVTETVERSFGPGALQRGRATFGHIPFTPRSKKVLELAVREAQHLRDDRIRSEHVLLGLIREGDGVAAKIMATIGPGLAELRRLVLRAMETAA
jgi:ATP-dependent Clp protease ATP-binding subunit ClpA